MGPHGPAWGQIGVGMGLAWWGRMGLARGRMGRAWGWHGAAWARMGRWAWGAWGSMGINLQLQGPWLGTG
jgi:hypothetical protein